MTANPLVPDDLVEFLLDHVIDLDRVLALPTFAGHTRETCALTARCSSARARRLARDVMFPAHEVRG